MSCAPIAVSHSFTPTAARAVLTADGRSAVDRAKRKRKQVINLKTNKLYSVMDNNFKEKIDAIITELSDISDLNIKISVLNYMEQQASFMLWQLEDDERLNEMQP